LSEKPLEKGLHLIVKEREVVLKEMSSNGGSENSWIKPEIA